MFNLHSPLNLQRLKSKLKRTDILKISEIENYFNTKFGYEDVKYIIHSHIFLKNQEIPTCSRKVVDKKA